MGPTKHLRKVIIALYVLAVLGFSVLSRAATKGPEISELVGVIYLTPAGLEFQVEAVGVEGPLFRLVSSEDLSPYIEQRVSVVGTIDKDLHKGGPVTAVQGFDPLSEDQNDQSAMLTVFEVTPAP